MRQRKLIFYETSLCKIGKFMNFYNRIFDLSSEFTSELSYKNLKSVKGKTKQGLPEF